MAPPAPWEQPKPSVLDYVTEGGGAMVRGAAGTLGSTLRGYGALGPQLAQEEIARQEFDQPTSVAQTPRLRNGRPIGSVVVFSILARRQFRNALTS